MDHLTVTPNRSANWDFICLGTLKSTS